MLPPALAARSLGALLVRDQLLRAQREVTLKGVKHLQICEGAHGARASSTLLLGVLHLAGAAAEAHTAALFAAAAGAAAAAAAPAAAETVWRAFPRPLSLSLSSIRLDDLRYGWARCSGRFEDKTAAIKETQTPEEMARNNGHACYERRQHKYNYDRQSEGGIAAAISAAAAWHASLLKAVLGVKASAGIGRAVRDVDRVGGKGTTAALPHPAPLALCPATDALCLHLLTPWIPPPPPAHKGHCGA